MKGYIRIFKIYNVLVPSQIIIIMNIITKSIKITLCLCALVVNFSLPAAEKPANIAIIDLDGGYGEAVDLLIVELAQQKDLIILERSEIDKILKEHEIALSNIGSNYLTWHVEIPADIRAEVAPRTPGARARGPRRRRRKQNSAQLHLVLP